MKKSMLLFLGFLAGCQSPAPHVSLERFSFAELHMGTLFSIVLYAPSEATANQAAAAAFRRIAELDDRLTDYDPESELMRLCRQPIGRPVPVSESVFDVLQQSERISRQSGGAFDVTVGPLVQLWRKARKSHLLPSSAEITEAAQAVGYQKVRLDKTHQTVTLLAPNMRLDVGGIAKGYAADQALRTLRGRGLSRALVAASGDIALGDPPPGRDGWSVGIESIDVGQTNSTRTVTLRNAGISTSGDTEQYVEIGGRRYSHIVDPATGLGLTERVGVTVIAPTATDSDALATTVSVMGARRGLALIESRPDTVALIITLHDGVRTAIASRGFAARSHLTAK
jgi:FAD:protein FMN transferase